MRKWLVGAFIVLLGVSWMWNGWYYYAQKLEKPLFLKHYYDLRGFDLGHVRLYMITSDNLDKQPYRLELSEDILLNVVDQSVREKRGRLKLHELIVSNEQLAAGDSETGQRGLGYGTYTFTEVKVYYHDGTTQMVPIGELTIGPNEDEVPALSSVYSKGSSDGTGEQSYVALRDFSIEAIKPSFADRIGDALHIGVNDRAADDPGLYPLAVPQDGSVFVKYKFGFSKQDSRRFHAYQVRITADERNKKEITLAVVTEQPILYGKDIQRYVQDHKKGAAQ